jgi:hypothetical protein
MKAILISLVTLQMISACAITDQHEEDVAELPEGVENCVYLPLVDRIEILDEQHILFVMRDGKLYNNHLSRKCPGLRRNDTIMYRTALNQLCNIDMFTVLENVGGGFMPGASCSFGKFYPATQEEVDALKGRRRE